MACNFHKKITLAESSNLFTLIHNKKELKKKKICLIIPSELDNVKNKQPIYLYISYHTMHGQIVKGGWVGWGNRYPCPPTIKTYQINLIKNLELSQEAKPTSDIPL